MWGLTLCNQLNPDRIRIKHIDLINHSLLPLNLKITAFPAAVCRKSSYSQTRICFFRAAKKMAIPQNEMAIALPMKKAIKPSAAPMVSAQLLHMVEHRPTVRSRSSRLAHPRNTLGTFPEGILTP